MVNMTARRRAVDARRCSRRTAREPLVVTGLGSPTYDVFAAGDRTANFYLWGAMGGAVPLGLGLALAQPDRSGASSSPATASS